MFAKHQFNYNKLMNYIIECIYPDLLQMLFRIIHLLPYLDYENYHLVLTQKIFQISMFNLRVWLWHIGSSVIDSELSPSSLYKGYKLELDMYGINM